MSFFTQMFGGKKDTIMTTGQAIRNLRETEDMLLKKQEYLEKKINQEIEIAKQNGSKNKRAAIQALKRKKRFMQQLNQVDGTISTLEMQREALENANTNIATISAMKTAADALKTAHKDLDTDKIHDIMDEVAEQQDISREISEAISNSITGQYYDEDELEKELEDLEQEALDAELLSTDTVTHELPEVPTSELKGPNKLAKEDEDLKALLSWAN